MPRALLPKGRLAQRAAAVLGILTLAGCGEGGTEPDPGPTPEPSVATVEVTSPIDTLLAVGWGATFEATARDAAGVPLDVAFTWSSSAPGVAGVDQSGAVTPTAAGPAVISATAGGVTGEARIQVLAADMAGASAIMGDPLIGHLEAGLGGSGDAVRSALAACESGMTTGNLVAVGGCLAALRGAAADSDQPDDRVLLAVLLLLSEHAARLLDL